MVATDPERLVWAPPAYGVVASGDMLAQLWEREAPAEAFDAILRWCVRRAKATPGRPLWMIAVSAPGSQMPDAEARAISARFPEFFTAFALVIEGSGFGASAARAVMASMSMMSRRRTRPIIAATVAEGCREMERSSGGALGAAALERFVAEARASLRG